MTSTAALVADYTARFAAGHLDEHSIGSGLGIWLLLALLAPAVEGDDRSRLEAVLGTDAEDAARRAAELLADPHPAVSAAVALWDRPEAMTEAFDRWATTLPPGLDRGPMPTQAEADAWAERHTLGMIPSFPLAVDARTLVVLASALAADVTWSWPFETTIAEELGGELGSTIGVALQAHRAHVQLIADTDAVGLVAVHAADAASGLRVISVIGPPEAPPDLVHPAAHQVAALLGGDPSRARAVDLFELPLGDGHAWTLDEHEGDAADGPANRQTVATVLAAWSARSDHDLADAPGMAAVERTLLGFADGDSNVFESRQSAFAEYTRKGFRAAAVTALGVRRAAFHGEQRVRYRRAEVRFNRPYAVVAVALDQQTEPEAPYRALPLGRPAWAGVPVFSAWVGRVEDTPVDDPRRLEAQLRRRRGRSAPPPMNAAAPAGPSPSSTRRTRAEPITTPSASAQTSTACSGDDTPTPTSTGLSVTALSRRAITSELAASGVALAGDTRAARRRRRSRGPGRTRAAVARRARSARPAAPSRPRRRRPLRAQGPTSSRGRSGRMAAATPLAARFSAKRCRPDAEGDVVVGHDRQRDAGVDPGQLVEDAVGGGAGLERLLAGRLDDRAVHDRVAERDADLDGVGPGIGDGPHDLGPVGA